MSDIEKQKLELSRFEIYLATAERVSDRRAAANTWLLSVNSFVAGLYGYLKTGEEVVLGTSEKSVWLITLPCVGILICIAWVGILQSYKVLNAAKFKVINEIEEKAEFNYFTRERLHYKAEKRRTLSGIEKFVPIAFIVLYAAQFLATLYGLS